MHLRPAARHGVAVPSSRPSVLVEKAPPIVICCHFFSEIAFWFSQRLWFGVVWFRRREGAAPPDSAVRVVLMGPSAEDQHQRPAAGGWQVLQKSSCKPTRLLEKLSGTNLKPCFRALQPQWFKGARGSHTSPHGAAAPAPHAGPSAFCSGCIMASQAAPASFRACPPGLHRGGMAWHRVASPLPGPARPPRRKLARLITAAILSKTNCSEPASPADALDHRDAELRGASWGRRVASRRAVRGPEDRGVRCQTR